MSNDFWYGEMNCPNCGRNLDDCSGNCIFDLSAVPVLADAQVVQETADMRPVPPLIGEARESTKSPKKGEILGSMPTSRGGAQNKLVRRTGLHRKKPMRRASKQRAAEYATYRSLKNYFLSQRPYCEMPSETGAPTCLRTATQVHHIKGRSGALLCDTRWFMAVCQECHDYIENHKKWARQKKLILY